jgi:hypothetical protein
MRRIGHDSTAAAIRYQHASAEADRRIADALDLGQDDEDDGPAGARVPAGT